MMKFTVLALSVTAQTPETNGPSELTQLPPPSTLVVPNPSTEETQTGSSQGFLQGVKDAASGAAGVAKPLVSAAGALAEQVAKQEAQRIKEDLTKTKENIVTDLLEKQEKLEDDASTKLGHVKGQISEGKEKLEDRASALLEQGNRIKHDGLERTKSAGETGIDTTKNALKKLAGDNDTANAVLDLFGSGAKSQLGKGLKWFTDRADKLQGNVENFAKDNYHALGKKAADLGDDAEKIATENYHALKKKGADVGEMVEEGSNSAVGGLAGKFNQAKNNFWSWFH